MYTHTAAVYYLLLCVLCAVYVFYVHSIYNTQYVSVLSAVYTIYDTYCVHDTLDRGTGYGEHTAVYHTHREHTQQRKQKVLTRHMLLTYIESRNRILMLALFILRVIAVVLLYTQYICTMYRVYI